MTDAEHIWRIWRRILREPPLQAAMFAADSEDRLAALGLDETERAVAGYYARHPAGTRFFITNYRFRMRSSFVHAIETTAPLTHRLLLAHRVDIDALAEEFLASVGWFDHGPWVFTYGGRILRYLVQKPALADLPGLRELVAIERAGIEVTIAASASDGVPPPPGSPDGVPPPGNPATAADGRATGAPPGRYRLAGPVRAVRTEIDITEWLRDSRSIGRTGVPAGVRWYLVFLRRPELRRRIVAVPRSAVDLVTELHAPRPVADRPDGPDAGQTSPVLDSLVRIGVVLAPGT